MLLRLLLLRIRIRQKGDFCLDDFVVPRRNENKCRNASTGENENEGFSPICVLDSAIVFASMEPPGSWRSHSVVGQSFVLLIRILGAGIVRRMKIVFLSWKFKVEIITRC